MTYTKKWWLDMLSSILLYCSLPFLVVLFDYFSSIVFKNKTYRKRFLFIIISLFLVLFAGLKSLNVGVDTKGYYEYFETCRSISFGQLIKQNIGFEKGFRIFTFILAQFRIPFHLYSVICYIIIFLPLILLSFKYSKFPSLTIAMYVGFGGFTLNLSGLRQSLACGICLIGLLIYFSTKNKVLKISSLFLILLGATFHKTSICFLTIPFINMLKFKTKNQLIFFWLTIILFLFTFPYLASFGYFTFTDFYSAYSFDPPSLTFSFSGTTVLLIAFGIISTASQAFNLKDMFNFSCRKIKENNPRFYIYTNNKCTFTDLPQSLFLFQMFMNILDISWRQASRMGLYGAIGFCVLIPNYIFRFNKTNDKINLIYIVFFCLLCSLYFYFVTLKYNYLNLMPYGVF